MAFTRITVASVRLMLAKRQTLTGSPPPPSCLTPSHQTALCFPAPSRQASARPAVSHCCSTLPRCASISVCLFASGFAIMLDTVSNIPPPRGSPPGIEWWRGRFSLPREGRDVWLFLSSRVRKEKSVMDSAFAGEESKGERPVPSSCELRHCWIRGGGKTVQVRRGSWQGLFDPCCVVYLDLGGDTFFAAAMKRGKGD